MLSGPSWLGSLSGLSLGVVGDAYAFGGSLRGAVFGRPVAGTNIVRSASGGALNVVFSPAVGMMKTVASDSIGGMFVPVSDSDCGAIGPLTIV
jgi:hypothetical protein